MKRVLIAGIGNVLLGDDGVGPFVVRLLESRYEFSGDVEVLDLGTPALDLLYKISGLDALVLIDSVAINEVPGTVALYRKGEILRNAPSMRVDQHSPALIDCLLAAEMLGSAPESVLLVGVAGQHYEPRCKLSTPVRSAVEEVIQHVLRELDRLGVTYRRLNSVSADIWWARSSSELPA